METLGLGGILKMDTRAFTLGMSRARQAFAQLKQGAQRIAPAAASVSTSFATMAAKVTAAGAKVVAAARTMATKVRVQFDRIRKGAAKVGRGLAQVGGGMRSAGMAMLPLTAALGFGVVQAASFEKQMYGVSAITGATGKDFEKLEAHALKMGMASVFSATESAEAMEAMGMAGFKNTEIMTGLEGILSAAAATNVGLAEATSIVAERIRGFGLTAADTSRVADVLALTTARANTDITALSEGMKYATPMAKMMGVSLEETATVLGMLADAGMKGSVGGTALKSALVKLSKPTSAAAKQIQKMGLTIKDGHGDFVGMQSILTQLAKGVNVYGGNVDRSAAMTELFGLRGMGLTSTLARMNKETAGGALTFGELHDQLVNAGGAAKEMADVRLKGLSGAFKMLGSAWEAANISMWTPILGPFTDAISDLAKGIRDVVGVMTDLSAATDEQARSQTFLTGLSDEYGETAVAVAQGVRDAMYDLGKAVDFVAGKFGMLDEKTGEAMGPEQIRDTTKLVVQIGLIAAVLGPVLLAITAIGFTVGPIITAIGGLGTVVSGLGSILAAVFSPWGLLVAGIVLVIVILKDQLMALGKGIWDAMGPSIERLGSVFTTISDAIGFMIDSIREVIGVTDSSTEGWYTAGGVIGSVLGAVVDLLGYVVKGLVWLVAMAVVGLVKVGALIFDWLLSPFQMVWQLGKNVFLAFKDIFSGSIMSGLKRLGATLLDTILFPLRLILVQLIKFADFIGMGGLVPEALRTVAEKGFAGLLFPEGEEKAGVKIVAKGAAPAEKTARALAKARAEEKAAAAKPPDTEGIEKAAAAGAARGAAEKRTTIENKIDLTVDGREAAYASAEHTQEIQERAGFKATPWQRRLSLEQGLPMPALVAIPRG